MAPGIAVSLLVAAVVFFITYCITWIYQRRKAHRFLKEHGIPGPEPTSLIYGNLEVTDDDFMKTFDQWREKYGQVYGYYVGDLPTVVLHDLEIIKQCFIKELDAFPDRLPWFVTTEPFKTSLLNIQGQEWKDVRSCLSPVFTTSKMRLIYNHINDSVSILLQELDKNAANGQAFDFYQRAKALTFDVIAKVALAIESDAVRDSSNPLFRRIKNSVEVSVGKTFYGYVTGFPTLLKLINLLFRFTEGSKTYNFVMDNIRYVISQRLKVKMQGAVDLLQLMIDAQEESNRNSNKILISDQHIISNSFLMLIAGYETTSTALGFSVYILSIHPEIQEKIYDEIKAKVIDKDELSYDDISSMKYLDMFFSEVLRMYPPVTLFTTRECAKDITVQGQFFPKGCVIQIPTYNLHYDPRVWSDPQRFDPERFSDENKKNIHIAAYTPFGIGPRICLGSRMAQNEAKLTIARLVRKFKVLKSEKTEVPLTLENKVVLLHPKNGVFVKLQKR